MTLYKTLDEVSALLNWAELLLHGPSRASHIRLLEFRRSASPLYVCVNVGWFTTQYTVVIRYQGIYGVLTFSHSNCFAPLLWRVWAIQYDNIAMGRFHEQFKEECVTLSCACPGLWPVVAQHMPCGEANFARSLITCMCIQQLLRFCRCNEPFSLKHQ